MNHFSRRRFLAASAPLALALSAIGAPCARAAATDQRYDPPQPFDFDRLTQQAATLAKKAYVAVQPPAADIVNTINFDLVQKIRFRADRTIWGDGARPFPVRLFRLDKFNPLPVRINVVDGATARQIIYSADDFDYGGTDLQSKLPPDLGFSGFRVMNGPKAETDWLAFQGASYFRSSGQDNQYGGSARGIAIDTVAAGKEEFPRFIEFWLTEPEPDKPVVTIYALLDGPSLSGAYRFV